MRSQRLEETLQAGRSFVMDIPGGKIRKLAIPKAEKTSLYVPSTILLDKKNGFLNSAVIKGVLLSDKWRRILQVICLLGDFAPRYGRDGLEDDPSRQQIIAYAAITCGRKILLYQRSTPKSTDGKFVGDPRLQGRYSIGFGGHKMREDFLNAKNCHIASSDFWGEGLNTATNMALAVDTGLLNEVYEETGIVPSNIKKIKILGAFHDNRIEDKSLKVQVGWVHTGLAAFIELDRTNVEKLRFRSSEVHNAWWYDISKINEVIKDLTKKYKLGTGPKVETWTEIMVKIFVPLLLK